MKANQKDGLAQDKGDSCAVGTLKNMIIPHDAAYLVSHALTNLQKDDINPPHLIHAILEIVIPASSKADSKSRKGGLTGEFAQ